MRVCVFASSSSGNCLLVSHNAANILIDAGISMRRIVSSLARAGLTMQDIGGMLITHEHSDHVSGLKMLLKHYKLDVYAPHTVANRLRGMLPDIEERLHIIPVGERFSIGGLDILAFHTSHDTDESVGYKVACDDGCFAIATDTGCITDEIFSALDGADTVLIEANHDVTRLCDGPYPIYLKRRILADTGHLSNENCALLARRLAERGTKQIVLGHLSQTNNTPELAYAAVSQALAGLDVELECAPVTGFAEFRVGESVKCCL